MKKLIALLLLCSLVFSINSNLECYLSVSTYNENILYETTDCNRVLKYYSDDTAFADFRKQFEGGIRGHIAISNSSTLIDNIHYIHYDNNLTSSSIPILTGDSTKKYEETLKNEINDVLFTLGFGLIMGALVLGVYLYGLIGFFSSLPEWAKQTGSLFVEGFKRSERGVNIIGKKLKYVANVVDNHLENAKLFLEKKIKL